MEGEGKIQREGGREGGTEGRREGRRQKGNKEDVEGSCTMLEKMQYTSTDWQRLQKLRYGVTFGV